MGMQQLGVTYKMNTTSEAEERSENDFLNQFYFQPICAQEAQIRLQDIKAQAKTSLARNIFKHLAFFSAAADLSLRNLQRIYI